MRKTLELIMTEHACKRLHDVKRFPIPPQLPLNEEVQLFRFRRAHAKRKVWMCEIAGGFLVGKIRHTKLRQMLIVLTAISTRIFQNKAYVQLACRRVVIDKITMPNAPECSGASPNR